MAWAICLGAELLLLGVVRRGGSGRSSAGRADESVHVGIGLVAALAWLATWAGWLTLPSWAQSGLATVMWCGSMALAAATLGETAATLLVPRSIPSRIARRARGGLFVVLTGALAMASLVWLTCGSAWLGVDTVAGPEGMQFESRVMFRLLNLVTFAIAGYAWMSFVLWAFLCDLVLWDAIRAIQPDWESRSRV